MLNGQVIGMHTTVQRVLKTQVPSKIENLACDQEMNALHKVFSDECTLSLNGLYMELLVNDIQKYLINIVNEPDSLT